MDKEEVPSRTTSTCDEFSCSSSRVGIRSSGGCNDGGTCASEFCGDEGDPLDVLMSVFGGKAEFWRRN